jgi:hypothetical protein
MHSDEFAGTHHSERLMPGARACAKIDVRRHRCAFGGGDRGLLEGQPARGDTDYQQDSLKNGHS